MKRPMSISFDDFSRILPSAVESAVADFPKFGDLVDKPTFFPGHGTVGFIVKDFGTGSFDLAEAHQLSGKIAANFGNGATANTVLRGNDILVGFFPAEQF
jgi:hypothetical protein